MHIFMIVMFLSCSIFSSEQSADQLSNFRAAVKENIDRALECDPEGRAAVVRNLLVKHKGVWPKWREILMQALVMGIPAPQLDSEYNPNLRRAVARNDAEMAKLLLEHKADPNMSNNLIAPALFWVDTAEMAKLLLEHRADVNCSLRSTSNICRSSCANLLFRLMNAWKTAPGVSDFHGHCVPLAQCYFDHGIDPMTCDEAGSNVLYILIFAGRFPYITRKPDLYISECARDNFHALLKLFIERGVPLYSFNRNIDNVYANLTLVERLRIDDSGSATNAALNAEFLKELYAPWKSRREKVTEAIEPHCGRNLTQLVLYYDDMEKFNQTEEDDKRCRALVEQQKKDKEERYKKLRKENLDAALALVRAPVTT